MGDFLIMKQCRLNGLMDFDKNVVYPFFEDEGICKGVCNALGYDVNKKMIMMNESLSSLGAFYVDVQLYKGVIAKVRVELIKK